MNGLAILLSIGGYIIRLKVLGSFHWDDLTHLIAVLLMTTQSALLTSFADLVRSLEAYSSHKSTKVPNFRLSLQANVAATMVGSCCLWAVKVTFLILYRLLFGVSTSFLKAWWAVTIFVIATFWATIAGSLIQCGASASHLIDIGRLLANALSHI